MKKWKRYLLTVSIITFLGTFCFAGSRPLIPVYAYYEHGFSYAQIGMIGAATGFFFFFFSVPFGRLSDWKGRKKVVLVGSIGLAVTPILLLFSSNFLQFFIVCAALGIFVAAWFPVMAAIAADVSFPKKSSIMSIYSVAISTAYTIAFFLSFFLLDFFISNFTLVFLLLSLTAVAATLLILGGIKGKGIESPLLYANTDTVFPTPKSSFLSKKRERDRDRERIGNFTLAAFAYGFFVGTIFVFFPVFAKSLEISYTRIGILLMSFSFVRTFTYAGMVKIMEIREKEVFMIIGLLGCSVSAFFISVFKHFYSLFCAFLLLGLTIGMVYPAALTIAAGVEEKGRAMGAYEAALGTGTFIGPLISGFLAERNPSSPYLLCTAVGMSIALVLILNFLYFTRKL